MTKYELIILVLSHNTCTVGLTYQEQYVLCGSSYNKMQLLSEAIDHKERGMITVYFLKPGKKSSHSIAHPIIAVGFHPHVSAKQKGYNLNKLVQITDSVHASQLQA